MQARGITMKSSSIALLHVPGAAGRPGGLQACSKADMLEKGRYECYPQAACPVHRKAQALHVHEEPGPCAIFVEDHSMDIMKGGQSADDIIGGVTKLILCNPVQENLDVCCPRQGCW